VNIRKAAEDARDAGMIRAHVRIPDLLAILDERDRYGEALEGIRDSAFFDAASCRTIARSALEQR
jgi:hypothetical protein